MVTDCTARDIWDKAMLLWDLVTSPTRRKPWNISRYMDLSISAEKDETVTWTHVSHSMWSIESEIGSLSSTDGFNFRPPIIMRFAMKSVVGSGKLNSLWKNETAESVEYTVAGARPASRRCAIKIQMSNADAGNHVWGAARESAKRCRRNTDFAYSTRELGASEATT